jgi:hypothetical protein
VFYKLLMSCGLPAGRGGRTSIPWGEGVGCAVLNQALPAGAGLRTHLSLSTSVRQREEIFCKQGSSGIAAPVCASATYRLKPESLPATSAFTGSNSAPGLVPSRARLEKARIGHPACGLRTVEHPACLQVSKGLFRTHGLPLLRA